MAPAPSVPAFLPPINSDRQTISICLNGGGLVLEDHSPFHSILLQNLAPGQPIQIHVRYQLTNSTVLTWETMYVDNTLYIQVPNGCLPDASKDAFVALLEYAEEVLNCDRAIIYFTKDRFGRDTLIRTFMFMGFFAVPPESPLLHFHEEDNVYLVYEIH